MDERVSLSEALIVVQHTKEAIRELESMLRYSSTDNFRKRLLSELEQRHDDVDFQRKVRALLVVYRDQFGVKDWLDHLDEATDLG